MLAAWRSSSRERFCLSDATELSKKQELRLTALSLRVLTSTIEFRYQHRFSLWPGGLRTATRVVLKCLCGRKAVGLDRVQVISDVDAVHPECIIIQQHFCSSPLSCDRAAEMHLGAARTADRAALDPAWRHMGMSISQDHGSGCGLSETVNGLGRAAIG